MRYTLLELVQQILMSMDSDEVNDIADTTESLDVANIVKECYFDIISEVAPKRSEGLFHLDASTDDLKPTLMYLPTSVAEVHWLKYNIGESVTETNFRDLCYMSVEDFFEYSNGLDLTESWVDTQVVQINGQDFNIKFRNDQSPTYWTSIDDRTLLFDSFDASYEDTLTSSRTYGYGDLIPTFQMSNNFVPQLDARQFQLLLNSAKAQAFIEKKQIQNATAEKKERKHRILAYKEKHRPAADNRSSLRRHNERRGYGR